MTTILIGHDLAQSGGITFQQTRVGTAREFCSITEANAKIDADLDSRIWKVYILTEVKP